MKAFLGVLFITLAMPGAAEAPSQDFIQIGDFGSVRLYLETPKDSALHALREQFDVLEDSKTGKVSVFSQGALSPGAKEGHLYAWVYFRNGKLSGVTKLWRIRGDRGVDAVRTIRGAMSSFGTPGRVCSVGTFDDHKPDVDQSGVVVSCGKRQVQVFNSRWYGNSGEGEGVVINEVLGSEEP